MKEQLLFSRICLVIVMFGSTIIIENLSFFFISVCKLVNITGLLTDCSLDCCQGDLCNKVSDTTPKPEPAGEAFRIGCKLSSHFVFSCPERISLTLYPFFVSLLY